MDGEVIIERESIARRPRGFGRGRARTCLEFRGRSGAAPAGLLQHSTARAQPIGFIARTTGSKRGSPVSAARLLSCLSQSGIATERRVRDRLHPPPSSLRVQRLPERFPAPPGKSRDFAGSWRSSQIGSEPETAVLGREVGRGLYFSLSVTQAVRIRSSFGAASSNSPRFRGVGRGPAFTFSR
jgi:hypothetical protein